MKLLILLPFVTPLLLTVPASGQLVLKHDSEAGTLSVFRKGKAGPILVQNAPADHRPFLHPIVAPDGKGVLTESRPQHHPHQTGLYWGFTRINGRDFFHHPGADYWRRVSTRVMQGQSLSSDPSVRWTTVYELLDEDGSGLMRETQTWAIREEDEGYTLDLEWNGEALKDLSFAQYAYGGMFLRMPWKPGVRGEVVNSARLKNERAEGRRAVWVDVGLQVEGRKDLAHIAIFDHPGNRGFPQAWRVDGQLGTGPAVSRLGPWQLKKGEVEQFKHRLRVYGGELDDVELTRRWGRYTGQGIPWVQWRLAQEEGRNAQFLTPEQAVKKMTLPDDFQVNVFAAEPMMTQPMAFCWDDRGRIWIAENRDYETRGKGFSNSGDSRIVILEDTDGDGTADKRKVFLEGIPFPSAIAVGLDGLWLGAPPNLLFVPDRDRNDEADVDDIEVRLTGWGIRDRHETINSLHWGPDGWLYGCQGFATPSRVGKPAGKGRIYRAKEAFPRQIEFAQQPVDINGGVWRYHPFQEKFEVVAHGFSNPWGIDYDAKGQLFITACVIPHLWHVIPGGIYHRQGGSHFNPNIYSDIRTIADHRHRSAHGGARVYLSDAFPEEYRGQLFMANIHEHAVLTDVLERRGSGYVGRHGHDFLHANNAQWVGFSVEIGPEGGVYILDWHDGNICGSEVLNKETGRIFRIVPAKSRAKAWEGRYSDLRTLSDLHLAKLQESESAWHARRARLILQGRAAGKGVERSAAGHLQGILASSDNQDHRLRALWALHATAQLEPNQLASFLDDPDEHLRAWSIQLLCEAGTVAAAIGDKFVQMAAEDSSAVVRLYLASALQRLPAETSWRIVERLARHAEDAEDHNLPKMIWFGLEPHVIGNPTRALKLARQSAIPLLTQHVARRLTVGGKLEELVAEFESPAEANPLLLLGMRDGLEGRYDVEAPAQWPAVFSKLRARDPSSAEIALQLSLQFGDKRAAETLLQTIKNEDAGLGERKQALRGLAARKREALKPLLVELLDHDELRLESLRAIAAFEDDTLARELLERYSKLSEQEKLEAVHTLASRSNYGRLLTAAIQNEQVPRADVPAYVARLLQRVVGPSFLEVWGSIEPLAADREAAFAKYRKLLDEPALAKADLAHGRDVFRKTCMACHKLYGEGGAIGPELTGANRTNLEYLLGNILTPSAVIQDNYRMHIVLTDDGRVFSGIPAGEDRRQIRLRVTNQPEPVIIPKSMIEDREVSKMSMMPEGLLKNLTDQEVVDLIAYLRELEQVPLEAAGAR